MEISVRRLALGDAEAVGSLYAGAPGHATALDVP